MWVPSGSSGFKLELKRALIPLSLGAITIIYFVARPPLWALIALSLILPGYFVIERFVFQRLRPSFERSFSRRVQRGDVPGLTQVLSEARLLRWMGPPGYLAEKRGLVASIECDWSRAADLLEIAYTRQPSYRRGLLLPALLRAKYETGAWDEATQIAQDLMGLGDLTGTPELFLGLILCRKPQRKEEGIELLEKATEVLGGSDLARARRALEELGPDCERS
jgi:hypothetical protein